MKTDELDRMQENIAALSQEIRAIGEALSRMCEMTEIRKGTEDQSYYYYIMPDGSVERGSWDSIGDSTLEEMRIGNNFATREEAEDAAEGLRVFKRMLDYGTLGPGDGAKLHYEIYADTRTRSVRCIPEVTTSYGPICFEDAESARRCVDEVGIERIVRYYFRIDDAGGYEYQDPTLRWCEDLKKFTFTY